MRYATLVVACLCLAASPGASRAQEAIPAAPELGDIAPEAVLAAPSETVPEPPEVASEAICVTPVGYCTFPTAEPPRPRALCHCGSQAGAVN